MAINKTPCPHCSQIVTHCHIPAKFDCMVIRTIILIPSTIAHSHQTSYLFMTSINMIGLQCQTALLLNCNCFALLHEITTSINMCALNDQCITLH